MTGPEFLAYVKRTFKRTDKDTEIYEAVTDTVFDMRLRFYSDDYKVRAYSTALSTVGDYAIPKPDYFGHLIGEVNVKDDTSEQAYTPLRKISIEDYDRLYPDRMLDVAQRNTGVPRRFCIYGSNILVGPCVDSTSYKFYLNYTEEDETAISASTTTVPFCDRYREVVKHGVLARMNRDLEMYQEAEYYSAEYEKGIAKIAANDDLTAGAMGGISYSGV
jgi:hypothetical protein